MKRSIRLLANDETVDTEAEPMRPALDFIRGELGLTGTKEGCREGDCGACAVLVGERIASSKGGAVLVGERIASAEMSFSYRAMPSCLLALGELEGRHLVTIEGLAAAGKPGRAGDYSRLTPVMTAMVEANGSQCGFCSPGFVVSLTAYLLNGDGARRSLSLEGAISAVEGNLCRCTGYGAIKRAAARLVEEFSGLPAEPQARLPALVEAGVLPASCLAFARGELLPPASTTAPSAAPEETAEPGAVLALGGGSDYFVRNPEGPLSPGAAILLDRAPELRRITQASAQGIGLDESAEGGPRITQASARGIGLDESAEGGPRITRENDWISIGAAVNWREFFASPELRAAAPGIERFEARLASPLVRERATVGGNIVNASPVGDLTSMLIALGALVRITRPDGKRRELPIESFFLGYKKLDLGDGEILASILVPAAARAPRFNFEKASKRDRLDIAAVNSAAFLELDGEARVVRARISAGGVAPVPLFLKEASAFLAGKRIDASTALEVALSAARIAAAEASPMSDIRGSADYRRRVLERLVLAHFIELFPGTGVEEAIA